MVLCRSLRLSLRFVIPLAVALAVLAYAVMRYMDNLPCFQIESYFELDARLGWRINKHLEASITGRNMLHDQHAEFAPTQVFTQTTQIPRSVCGEITWQF